MPKKAAVANAAEASPPCGKSRMFAPSLVRQEQASTSRGFAMLRPNGLASSKRSV
jgi:hypothetical protein